VNVARGLREVGAVYLDLMRSYAASDVTILRKVRVPHAVPYLFTALKIAAPASVITAFVSEYFGGLQNGLGSRIVSNIALSNNAEAWATCSAPACWAGVLPDGRGARAGADAGWVRQPGAGWGMMGRLEGNGAPCPGGRRQR
jgi:ABC-type nitrate/sulfonate/bicarbonate transport system, permease component